MANTYRPRTNRGGGASVGELRRSDEEQEPEMAIGDLRRQDNESIQSQKPLSPEVRAALAKKNPQLIEEYNRRMGIEDANVAEAQKKQNMMGYVDVIGKAGEDYINSRREPVILDNRFQDLGKEHNTIEPEKYKFDNSLANNMVDNEMAQAKEGRKLASERYDTEMKLGDRQNNLDDRQTALDSIAAKKDPNSEASRQARENLKLYSPDIGNKLPNFENATAEQLEKAAPLLMKRMEADAAERRHKESMAATRYNRQQALANKPTITPEQQKWKNVPEDNKEVIKNLARNNSNKVAIANQIDAVLKNAEGLSEDGQLQQYRQLIKTLNSTQGADAVGEGESKRLAGQLEFAMGNLTNDNPVQWGRDLEGFRKDAQSTSRAIRDAIKANQVIIDQGYGRETQEQAPVSEYPKTLRKDGKIATVNSEEELKEAQTDGWK